MNKSDKKFVRKWRKTKRKGFFRYTFTQGLIFGILVGGFNAFFIYIDHPEELETTEFIFKMILIVFGVALIYALFSWFLNNFIYKHLKK